MPEPVDPTLDEVDVLLDRVLAEPEHAQESLLARLCAEHPQLASTLRRRHQGLRSLGLADEAVPDQVVAPERLGEFTLLERIGGGGMGVVYRARQEPLGRIVALKLVRPEFALIERSHARFRREAEAVARLDHHGIVPVFTVGVLDGVPYLAMPFVDGVSLLEALLGLASLDVHDLGAADLARVVGCEGRPPWFDDRWPRVCVRIALRLADALSHAHRRGVLHRDVKPSNVMLARDGRVLLLDFGLAAAEGAEPLTRPGVHMGSMGYAAPEQVLGAATDARTDVFSLGTVLYELLSLRPAFTAADTKLTIQRVLQEDPPPLRGANPAVDLELEAIVLRCLEKDPARRYRTAAALGLDLEAWLDGRPVSVRPLTGLRRGLRWARRQPLRAALLATSLTTALAVAGGAGWWIASRPILTAGRERLAADRRERLLAGAFLALAQEDRGVARAGFADVLQRFPDCAEAAAGLALSEGRALAGAESAAAGTPQALFLRAAPLVFGGARGDHEPARVACGLLQDALVRAPAARPLYHFALARAAAVAGEAETARRTVAGIRLLWPASAHALYWCGYALLEVDRGEAIACLREALALDPSLVRARADLGLALLLDGDAAAAERELGGALAADPGNARARVTLASAKEQQGDLDGAVRELRAAVAAAPDHPGAHYNLGRLLGGAGEADAATASLVRALELAPDYAEAHLWLARLKADAKDGDGALASLRQAAALRPDWSLAQRHLAVALAERGDARGAAGALARVVALEPDDEEAHGDYCRLLEYLGDETTLAAERRRWLERPGREGR